MAIRITGDMMTLEAGDCVATARFSEHAAADGNDAWIVSAHPGWLFTHDQAISTLTAAELLKLGYADNDPLVIALIAEL
jgi:hypothetical protein